MGSDLSLDRKDLTSMKLNFRQDVIVLPGTVLSCCDKADAARLRVLLWLASDLTLAQKPQQLAKLAGCTVKAVGEALEYWTECGVLTDSEDGAISVMASAVEEKPDKKQEKRTLIKRADVLPNYTSTELAELIEHRHGMREMIDEAQQILGKIFNPSEINILVGMVDYLALEEDCILLLLAHCKRIGKSNLRAIEKYAYSLVDAGITDATSLEERICRIELMYTFEGEVRTLFGMKSRALSTKEKKMLETWCGYGYDIEVVRRAYDITINATNEPSVAYANAIMERWHAEGLGTAEEIDARLLQEANEKGTATGLGNSFDTDDFFEAALQRSFGQNDQ